MSLSSAQPVVQVADVGIEMGREVKSSPPGPSAISCILLEPHIEISGTQSTNEMVRSPFT